MRFYVDERALGLGKALEAARKDTIHPGHKLAAQRARDRDTQVAVGPGIWDGTCATCRRPLPADSHLRG
jgi:hypothetical protein